VAQVEESIPPGKYLPLQPRGVRRVSIVPQVKALRSGVDVLVFTLRRLLDHVQQRTVDLSRVEI
jgi:ATP-dependent RNA helicase RhlE